MSTAAIVVRPASMGDTAAIHECVSAVIREERYLAFTRPFSFVETAFYLARVLDAKQPYFVAAGAGRVVGWCDVTPARGDVHAHIGVLGMGVASDWRGQGIGARLIEAALEASSELFEQVELHVFASNERARALYRKAGFVEQGCRRGGRKHAGLYDDDIIMTHYFVEPTP